MGLIWTPQQRTQQPPVPRPLAKWLSAHEVAGIYQTVPGGRWDAQRGKLQAVTTVARTAGLCPSANSYNVTVAVPGQDLGAVWFAQIALDNTSYYGYLAALYSSENYNNGHGARIGWDDYSTNVLNFYFKYSSYSAVSQNVTLAAGKRVAGIAMYVDAAEVTCYVDGVEVATAAQTATLAATHYAFTGTSTGGQHVSSYGEAYQSKGTTCAGSLFGPKALARELSRNPWAAFAPDENPVWFTDAGGGPTYTLTAAQGSFTLTGQSTSLTAQRKLTAAQGSYTLSGQTSALKAGRKLTASQGSFTLSGQAAALKAARKLAANQGSFTLTGQDTGLIYTPGSGPDYTLTAGHGSFALTGQATALQVARKLVAAYTTYELDGQNATLTYSGNLHGFTQDQLDFIVEYVAAHTSKLYINAITGDVEYLINLGN